MKATIILILSLVLSVFAQSVELSDIQSLIPKDSVVRATFIQTKEMKTLEKTLVSSGKILVVREKGVVWLTQTPTLMKKVIPLIEEETTKSEYAMITQFFTEDFSAIQERFEIELAKDEKFWTLTIFPKSSALKRRLKSIKFKSDYENREQEIIILSADDNSLKINFVCEIPTLQILSENEEKLFDE